MRGGADGSASTAADRDNWLQLVRREAGIKPCPLTLTEKEMDAVTVYESEFGGIAGASQVEWVCPTQHKRQFTKFQQKKWLKKELTKAWNMGKTLDVSQEK